MIDIARLFTLLPSTFDFQRWPGSHVKLIGLEVLTGFVAAENPLDRIAWPPVVSNQPTSRTVHVPYVMFWKAEGAGHERAATCGAKECRLSTLHNVLVHFTRKEVGGGRVRPRPIRAQAGRVSAFVCCCTLSEGTNRRPRRRAQPTTHLTNSIPCRPPFSFARKQLDP